MNDFEEQLKYCANESDVMLLIAATLDKEKIPYSITFVFYSSYIYVNQNSGGYYRISMNSKEYLNNEVYIRDTWCCDTYDVVEFMKMLMEDCKPKE